MAGCRQVENKFPSVSVRVQVLEGDSVYQAATTAKQSKPESRESVPQLFLLIEVTLDALFRRLLKGFGTQPELLYFAVFRNALVERR